LRFADARRCNSALLVKRASRRFRFDEQSCRCYHAPRREIFPGAPGLVLNLLPGRVRRTRLPAREQTINLSARKEKTMSGGAFVESIGNLIEKTHLVEQIKEVDFPGLFTNPWFLVPFVVLVGYLLYKKAFRDMIIIGAIIGAWYASGTPYMQTLVVDGHLQVGKVLPVLFGGAALLGLVIYLLIGRSD